MAVSVPSYRNIVILWHGGEPLLMGADFFSRAYEVFDEYARKYGVKFTYRLQTNGTLLDDRLMDFFASTNTRISISYDGKYNDVLRQQTERVEQVVKKLRDRGELFGCMTTVSSADVDRLQEMYEFFKELKVPTKFSVIFPDGAAADGAYLVGKEEWTREFIKFFEYWFYDTECNIEMPACSDVLYRYLFKGKKLGCGVGACLFGYIAVNAEGDLYPCGRLIEDRYRLANVYEIDNITDAFGSEKFLEIFEKSKKRISGCKACKWFDKCHGGCMAIASIGGDIARKSDFECYFNRHVFDKIEELMKVYDPLKTNPYANETIEKYGEGLSNK